MLQLKMDASQKVRNSLKLYFQKVDPSSSHFHISPAEPTLQHRNKQQEITMSKQIMICGLQTWASARRLCRSRSIFLSSLSFRNRSYFLRCSSILCALGSTCIFQSLNSQWYPQGLTFQASRRKGKERQGRENIKTERK